VIVLKRTCPICQKEYNLDKLTESIIKDFPDKKEFWIKSSCPDAPNHFLILRKREVALVPKETKQKVLDLMHEGKTIGEICAELNLKLDITCEIINQNIQKFSILRTEAVS
jgi:hypothetical protein